MEARDYQNDLTERAMEYGRRPKGRAQGGAIATSESYQMDTSSEVATAPTL